MLVVPFDRDMIKSIKGNIFVKNIAPEVSNRELYELFKKFGEIFSVKLALDYSGKSKRYGFVQYRDPASADKAIAEMNGKEIRGRKLIVDPYKPGERKNPSVQSYSNVFVKNLPPDITTKEALDNLFASFGPRTSVGIFPKELNGKVGYYGFVSFANSEDAVKAVTAMNDKEISGVKLYVARALPKDQRVKEQMKRKIQLRNESRMFTLHVKLNKEGTLNEELVKEQLGQFGEMKSISIQKMKDPVTGQEVNSAVGFAVFAKSEDAKNVLTPSIKFRLLPRIPEKTLFSQLTCWKEKTKEEIR